MLRFVIKIKYDKIERLAFAVLQTKSPNNTNVVKLVKIFIK